MGLKGLPVCCRTTVLSRYARETGPFRICNAGKTSSEPTEYEVYENQ
ncbi:MAG: hypothetical protein KJ704_01955 [Proteobacteria bacterium]|nr:hypothetical protein [Pseudomonadota bacterium]MBU2234910.1 hypothetical protein [Pseudomonadota bacterium]